MHGTTIKKIKRGKICLSFFLFWFWTFKRYVESSYHEYGAPWFY